MVIDRTIQEVDNIGGNTLAVTGKGWTTLGDGLKTGNMAEPLKRSMTKLDHSVGQTAGPWRRQDHSGSWRCSKDHS